MRRILITGGVIALVVLVLPVSNLVLGLPRSSLAEARSDDPRLQALLPTLGTKCAACHTPNAERPFYADMPVAKEVVNEDVSRALQRIDLRETLLPQGGGPPSEVALARIEKVLEDDAMPPTRFVAMHWNAGLRDEDAAALRTYVREVRQERYATGTAAPEFAAEVVQPLPDRLETDPARAALGQKLFHDGRLSKDGTVSCASCHDLEKGGAGPARVSTGVGGQIGPVNAPTVFNAALATRLFWDGRATDLVEQAAGPVENPLEMAGTWDEALPRLKGDDALAREFQAAYPDGVTRENVLHAIAEFEKTLITPDAPFDRYLRGEAEAVSDEVRQGYGLFKSHGCATCHVGKALGGQSFEVFGLERDYLADRGGMTDADRGRWNVTHEEKDLHRFKVPTLRNVALTAPYLHDGSAEDLEEVVEVMGRYQLGRDLPTEEVRPMVAFLDSLTGTWNGRPLR